MHKKLLCVICATILLLSVVAPNALAATVINEDVSINAPIYSEMETAAAAQSVDSQLTGASSSASLCDDAVEGDFALKVSAADETGTYAEYTLVSSDTFSTSTYSRITLWVKPGAGAEWVSFYTNSVLITSDEDGDGKYEVGTDLQSGTWTQLALDLLDTDAAITTGDDLVVRSDENSVWYFDGITSQRANSTTIDLSTMVNDQTTLNNGRLEFNKTSNGTAYDVSPTTLVSNRDTGLEMEFTTEADFAGGICKNVEVNSSGSVMYNSTDICKGGIAVSGGDTNSSLSYAFDDSSSTSWMSSQSGSSIVGNAYIGYDFGTEEKVVGLGLMTSSSTYIDLAYLQYFDTNTSVWITVETINISNTSTSQYYWFSCSVSASQWRLLAANYNSTYNQYWQIYNLEFYSSEWSYTSSELDISTTEKYSKGEIDFSGLECSSVEVSTQLSLDGGATWQNWAVLSNDGSITGIDCCSNFSTVRLKYRISGSKTIDEYIPTINSVTIKLTGYDQETDSINGKIQGIIIDNKVADVLGTPATTQNSSLLNLQNCTNFELSGNGELLFYISPIDGYLYSMDMETGAISLLVSLSTLGLNSITDYKADYEGTVLYINGINTSECYCFKRYNIPSASSGIQLFYNSNNPNLRYDIQNNGGIAYSYMYTSAYDRVCYYAADGSIMTLFTETTNASYISNLAIAKSSGDIFYIYSSDLYSYSAASDYTSSLGSTLGDVSSILCASNDGSEVYIVYNGSPCSYNPTTGVIRPIDSDISSMEPLNDGIYFVIGSNDRYYLYNPSTNEKEDITPSDASTDSTAAAIDRAGNILIYPATYNFKVKYLNSADKVNKYLLSFDGKNTWYSYGNGIWAVAWEGKTPDESAFSENGMTAEQVNALTKADFDKLYSDGTEIYSVDVAVYFNSVSYEYTPSIGSIQIITDEDSYGNAADSTANPLYAAKSTDFAGSGWRTIKRIYPVEVCDKDTDYLYFFYANGKYMYFENSAWHVESTNEISSLIADVEANWIDLKLIGMTAGEVRAIPQSALTSELAGVDFSVVYCMRVPDKSTVGYSSLITVDYTEQLYTSGTLTLTITYSNGSTQQMSGMTKIQVEDFMEWLLYRTKSSSTYYTITVGFEHYYICYYMISNVSVTES